MAGLDQNTPIPSDIKLHTISRTLELIYEDINERYELPCEFLRVFTPSAEARGHAPGQEVLQHGCQNVSITRIEPIGNYALRLVFSDGHDTGLYSWDLLYDLSKSQHELWADYLSRIAIAGLSRDPAISKEPIDLNRWRHKAGTSCGHDHNHD